jgi:ankyrin repeat protein
MVCTRTNITTIYKLIERGATVNIKCNNNSSILQFVRQSKVTKYIIDHSARGNELQFDDNRSIISELYLDTNNDKHIKLLLENGDNPNMINNYKDSPLFYAVRNEEPSIDAINLLIDYGGKINYIGSSSFSVL